MVGIECDSLSGTKSLAGEVPDGRDKSTPGGNAMLAGCVFVDKRLGQRLRKLLERMAGAMGASMPLACQDWANTKAAYRFFSNDRVGEAEILAGHFQATRDRFAATAARSWCSRTRPSSPFSASAPRRSASPAASTAVKDKAGRFSMHTVCGLLMHSSLAVTTEGLPLGLSAVKFWSRKKFKGTAALKRKINPTRVPIEEGERPLAGEHAPVHRPARRTRTMRPYR